VFELDLGNDMLEAVVFIVGIAAGWVIKGAIEMYVRRRRG